VEFNPESFAELAAMAGGERNGAFRMVLGYWDLAASLVTTKAIDGDAFRAAHGEIFATFSKVQPFLSEFRAATGEPEFCKHYRERGYGRAGCRRDYETAARGDSGGCESPGAARGPINRVIPR
jgi:hypothetical protein